MTCDTSTNLPTEPKVLVQKSYFEEGQQGTEVERWPTPLQHQMYSIIMNELGKPSTKAYNIIKICQTSVQQKSDLSPVSLFASIDFPFHWKSNFRGIFAKIKHAYEMYAVYIIICTNSNPSLITCMYHIS